MGNNYSPSTPNGVDGFSGYAKSSNGKIVQIAPWVKVNGVLGARIGVENIENEPILESMSVYPNPTVNAKNIDIYFSTTINTPMKIRLLDQNGTILKEIDANLSKGKHSYNISLDNIGDSPKFIYYQLDTKQHNEIKRVLLTR